MKRALEDCDAEHRASEMVSPALGSAALQPWERIPRFVLDLIVNDQNDGMPWDSDVAEKAAKARRIVEEKRALLLMGSPLCATISQVRSAMCNPLSSPLRKRSIRNETFRAARTSQKRFLPADERTDGAKTAQHGAKAGQELQNKNNIETTKEA